MAHEEVPATQHGWCDSIQGVVVVSKMHPHPPYLGNTGRLCCTLKQWMFYKGLIMSENTAYYHTLKIKGKKFK